MIYRVPLPSGGAPGTVVEIPLVSAADPGLMSVAQAALLFALASSRPVIPETVVNLTDTVTKSIIVIDWSQIPDGSSAFTMNYAVECTDGTNVQIQSGSLNANAARASNGTYATNVTPTGTTNTVTSGGMTVTFSWDVTTTPNFPVLRVNANSSLVPTLLRITFYIAYATHPQAISVAP